MNEESAKLALMELADAFGVDQTPEPGVENALLEWVDDSVVPHVVKHPSLLPLAMEGRLYLEDGKAVYVLLKPLKLTTGEVSEVRLREPLVSDYTSYSKGMSFKTKDGETVIEPDVLLRWTVKIVSVLGNQPQGILDRAETGLTKRDGFALMEVCKALGFFE